MNLTELLVVLRRRKYVIVAIVLLGAVLGYVTAPGEVEEPPVFKSTTTMVSEQSERGTAAVNLDQASLLAVTGEVPERVAERLDLDPNDVRDQIKAIPDSSATQSLKIEATSLDADVAEDLSAATAEELIALLNEELEDAFQAAIDAADAGVERELDELEVLQFIANEDDVISDDERRSLIRAEARVTNAVQRLENLTLRGANVVPLEIIDTTSASVLGESGWSAPEGKPERAGFLALFGLVLGGALAILLAQLDTRIRTRSEAEAAFGQPVVAEVPPRGKELEEAQIATVETPAHPVAEAYRTLRTPLLLDADRSGSNGRKHQREAQVVLVTSALASEGKTSSSVELAAVLAEAGKRVVVIGADMRRPRAHQLFDVPRDPGMVDLFVDESSDVRTLRQIHRKTNVRNVDYIPSGPPIDNPAPHLGQVRKIITAARRYYDFVIVDTAPLLAANDANELASAADMVLLAARAGRTTTDAAKRVGELLEFDRFIGVVLIGASEAGSGYGYYRYRYRYEPSTSDEAPKRRKRRNPATETAGATS